MPPAQRHRPRTRSCPQPPDPFCMNLPRLTRLHRLQTHQIPHHLQLRDRHRILHRHHHINLRCLKAIGQTATSLQKNREEESQRGFRAYRTSLPALLPRNNRLLRSNRSRLSKVMRSFTALPLSLFLLNARQPHTHYVHAVADRSLDQEQWPRCDMIRVIFSS